MADPTNEGINPSQIITDKNGTKIAFAELVRVFGEPRGAMGTMGTTHAGAAHDRSPINDENRHEAEELRHELMQELRDRAKNAEERAQKAEERERAERERADRYESQIEELRQKNNELTTRLLPPPPKPGLFARLFGR